MMDRQATAFAPPEDGITLWLPDFEPEVPTLPAPTVLAGPAVPDGPITYGLVAKVSLARPGFGFRVEHDLPSDVDLVDAKPKAKVVGDHLIWQLGRIDPGQEIRLEVTVKPRAGAQLNREELASFEATYSQNLYFQAPVARPRLAARWAGPPVVAVGDVTEFLLDVAASGNWRVECARAVVSLPTQFEHPDGPQFEFALGDLRPKEYRRVRIPVRAVLSGPAVLKAEVTGPAGHTATVEIKTVVE
jgi:hypothetical protein